MVVPYNLANVPVSASVRTFPVHPASTPHRAHATARNARLSTSEVAASASWSLDGSSRGHHLLDHFVCPPSISLRSLAETTDFLACVVPPPPNPRGAVRNNPRNIETITTKSQDEGTICPILSKRPMVTIFCTHSSTTCPPPVPV